MEPDTGHRLVLCTCPSQETALALGTHLVEQGLAACVNVVPGLTSIYLWEGAIQREPEVLLLIKTLANRLDVLTDALRRLHPYDLPEIIALPITGGLPEYLNWVSQCTRPPTPQ
ncbi:MAG: divalent-cation tolerance protein CutA [Bdellovibrio bacteriovorus]